MHKVNKYRGIKYTTYIKRGRGELLYVNYLNNVNKQQVPHKEMQQTLGYTVSKPTTAIQNTYCP